VSKLKESAPVKLIVSLITGNSNVIRPVLEKMEDKFGSMDFLSEKLAFNHTDYYKEEMGDELFRKFVSFEKLIKPDTLPDIKFFTNSLEQEYLSGDGKRMVNIDPGYISMERLVLATGKNFTHRIYLRDGIYADLTLVYKGGSFQALEWTFPDYAEADMRKLLGGIRDRYAHQLKQGEY
jgi:hypothetical protein